MPFLPYPPATTEAAIEVLRQDIGITHEVVHGNTTKLVDTESGQVPSFAKAINDFSKGIYLKLVNTSDTSIAVDGGSQSKHFICTSNSAVNVTLNATTVETDNIAILVFFTQVGEGVVNLNAGVGVDLILPQDSTPTTFDKGSTIAAISVANNKWVITGNLGY